jgi:hypothetical protein
MENLAIVDHYITVTVYKELPKKKSPLKMRRLFKVTVNFFSQQLGRRPITAF